MHTASTFYCFGYNGWATIAMAMKMTTILRRAEGSLGFTIGFQRLSMSWLFLHHWIEPLNEGSHLHYLFCLSLIKKQNNNIIGFGFEFPSFSYGRFMELMAVPKRKVPIDFSTSLFLIYIYIYVWSSGFVDYLEYGCVWGMGFYYWSLRVFGSLVLILLITNSFIFRPRTKFHIDLGSAIWGIIFVCWISSLWIVITGCEWEELLWTRI